MPGFGQHLVTRTLERERAYQVVRHYIEFIPDLSIVDRDGSG